MPGLEKDSDSIPPDLPRRFETTRWAMVMDARGSTPRSARAALEDLCRIYWYPVYSFIRHSGLNADQAKDATQSFFASVLERDLFASASPERGRLRSFLMKSAQNHLLSLKRAERAHKRGPLNSVLSIDELDPERRFHLEPQDLQTPQRAFERQWALAVIEQGIAELRSDLAGTQTQSEIDLLIGFLTGESADISMAEAAEQMGISVGAMKGRLHRLRARYREVLRRAVADTVGVEGDVEDELQVLMSAL